MPKRMTSKAKGGVTDTGNDTLDAYHLLAKVLEAKKGGA